MNTSQASDEEMCRIIAGAIPKKAAKGGVRPDMSLRGDLGVDSLALMSIVFVLEEKTGIDAFGRVDAFVAAESVADVIAIVRRG
ncbi:acyl carrier protein [Streptomyces drozdowiczii]|uniref:Acyl carrier protein n=1 Tax=Streptomyces drozdowiczii TaxID=202862 RepID=A0ABY6PZU1_9ACTN|nr:acyl carrier protein [Streptomyces drozdowiczii]MCX0242553.1 acyl carrier protein [Streptomyces drozdowiczii]UZK57406.1 acyl carrier protein [Streptomyces drozdowiczii]